MKLPRAAAYGRSVLILLLLTTNMSGGLRRGVPEDLAKQAKSTGATASSTAKRNLYLMGGKISKAVLDKDIPALLTYDRADLRAQDEIALQNPKGDLYCYIFDSDCITWGDGGWRSVYDKLSQAHALEIKAQVARSPADRQLYGSLLFYDGSTVSEKDLQSPDFLCREAPAKIASWKFRLEKGKWISVTPLFDAETETLCPQ
jgi:hypothetical protein